MALATLAKNDGTPPKKGPSCAVCIALETLPEAEADGLRSLLANRSWRYSELSDALRDDPDTPLDIAAQSLARHARGGCSARDRLR